jgi:MOSC domain-containing protein
VATVARISIAPVKGLGLVQLDAVELERTGVAANRRFHVVDADGRRFNQLRNGELVRIRPDYDPEREHLTLAFPDGVTATGGVRLGGEIVTDFYGRPVRGRLVEGPWNAALSEFAGRPLRLVQSDPGEAIDRDRGHVSLVSQASLAELAAHAGRETVDGRRFRMLFELADAEAHVEDDWVGLPVRIGEALVGIRGDVGRCSITTQNPDTGKPDFDTLRTIDGYRSRTHNAKGKEHVPFGVYGEVLEPGRVALGDEVEAAQAGLLDATA